MADIVRLLKNITGSSTATPVVVPYHMTSAGDTYSFGLQLVNIFRQSAFAQAAVRVLWMDVSNKISISASILGSQSQTMFSWQNVDLFGRVVINDCSENSPLTTQVTYHWNTYDNLTYSPNIRSMSKDSRYFRLAAYTLLTYHSYTIQLIATVSMGNQSILVRSTDSVFIYVLSSVLMVSIRGGEQQTQSVSMHNNVVLDASNSRDINYPCCRSLTFQWSCSVVAPNFGDACPPLTDSNQPIVKLKPSKHLNNVSIVQFTVCVSNEFSVSCKHARVRLVYKILPSITASVNTNIITTSRNYSVFNVADKIVVSASISSSWRNKSVLLSFASSNFSSLNSISFNNAQSKILPQR